MRSPFHTFLYWTCLGVARQNRQNESCACVIRWNCFADWLEFKLSVLVQLRVQGFGYPDPDWGTNYNRIGPDQIIMQKMTPRPTRGPPNRIHEDLQIEFTRTFKSNLWLWVRKTNTSTNRNAKCAYKWCTCDDTRSQVRFPSLWVTFLSLGDSQLWENCSKWLNLTPHLNVSIR